MKIFALFSGQGAQKVGMGKDLQENSAAAREVFAKASGVLDLPVEEVMFSGPDEELTRTSYCQPALYIHGLAALAALQERVAGIEVVGTAGLSLGEFTAHAAAQSYSFEDGLRLVARRGAAMERACNATSGTMAAMIGGKQEDVEKLAAEAGVDIANLNAPGQIVLSGTKDGIEQACAKASEFGIRRAIALPVAGAYHSKLMQQAQSELATALAETEMQSPQVPVWANVEGGAIGDVTAIKDALTRQVTGSVRWSQCMDSVLEEFGEEVQFVEFGPDQTLAGLLAKIRRGSSVLSISDTESLEKAVEFLASV